MNCPNGLLSTSQGQGFSLTSTLRRRVANKVIKMPRDASKMTKSGIFLGRPLRAAWRTTERQDAWLTLWKFYLFTGVGR